MAVLRCLQISGPATQKMALSRDLQSAAVWRLKIQWRVLELGRNHGSTQFPRGRDPRGATRAPPQKARPTPVTGSARRWCKRLRLSERLAASPLFSSRGWDCWPGPPLLQLTGYFSSTPAIPLSYYSIQLLHNWQPSLVSRLVSCNHHNIF